MKTKESLATLPLESYKNRDWCYYEFTLGQATIKKGNNFPDSHGFTTGVIATGGNMIGYLYPMTMRVKLISQVVDNAYEEIRATSRQLNFPDIKRKMVSYWTKALHCDSDEELNNVYGEIRDFVQKIREAVEGSEVNGVKLFR